MRARAVALLTRSARGLEECRDRWREAVGLSGKCLSAYVNARTRAEFADPRSWVGGEEGAGAEARIRQVLERKLYVEVEVRLRDVETAFGELCDTLGALNRLAQQLRQGVESFASSDDRERLEKNLRVRLVDVATWFQELLPMFRQELALRASILDELTAEKLKHGAKTRVVYLSAWAAQPFIDKKKLSFVASVLKGSVDLVTTQ